MKFNVAILQKTFFIVFLIFSFQLSSNAIGINGLAVNTPTQTIASTTPYKITVNGQKSITNYAVVSTEKFNSETNPISELSNAVGEEVSSQNTSDAFMAFGLVTFMQVILILLSPVIIPRLIKAVKL